MPSSSSSRFSHTLSWCQKSRSSWRSRASWSSHRGLRPRPSHHYVWEHSWRPSSNPGPLCSVYWESCSPLSFDYLHLVQSCQLPGPVQEESYPKEEYWLQRRLIGRSLLSINCCTSLNSLKISTHLWVKLNEIASGCQCGTMNTLWSYRSVGTAGLIGKNRCVNGRTGEMRMCVNDRTQEINISAQVERWYGIFSIYIDPARLAG